MKYSACIEMLFQDVELIERIYKAKEAGFQAVEFWLWQPKDLNAIKKALNETGLEVAVFQGNIQGRMIDSKDNEIYINGVKKSVEAAKKVGAKHLFLMTDILQEDRTVLEPPYPISEEEKIASIKKVLNTLMFVEPISLTRSNAGLE